MGNSSSKSKRNEQLQQQFDQEPEFNPPYTRPSRIKHLAHSMDEIRESSGSYLQSQHQQRQQREIAKIRASVPVASQANYPPTPSQTYYVPTSPQSYHAPTPSQPYNTPIPPQSYHGHNSPRPHYASYNTPIPPLSYHGHNSPRSYYAPTASNHEREMALIRESSGAHLH